jgi:hypothetical protein
MSSLRPHLGAFFTQRGSDLKKSYVKILLYKISKGRKVYVSMYPGFSVWYGTRSGLYQL